MSYPLSEKTVAAYIAQTHELEAERAAIAQDMTTTDIPALMDDLLIRHTRICHTLASNAVILALHIEALTAAPEQPEEQNEQDMDTDNTRIRNLIFNIRKQRANQESFKAEYEATSLLKPTVPKLLDYLSHEIRVCDMRIGIYAEQLADAVEILAALQHKAETDAIHFDIAVEAACDWVHDCRTCGRPSSSVDGNGDCSRCRQMHDYVPDDFLFCTACNSWSAKYNGNGGYDCMNIHCDESPHYDVKSDSEKIYLVCSQCEFATSGYLGTDGDLHCPVCDTEL